MSITASAIHIFNTNTINFERFLAIRIGIKNGNKFAIIVAIYLSKRNSWALSEAHNGAK